MLHILVLFMIRLPATMVPLFDAKNGIRAVFKLLSSENEAIRIQALKLLGHFMSRSTSRSVCNVKAFGFGFIFCVPI